MSNYRPKYVYWELSNYCNLRCKHCFANAINGRDSIVPETLIYSAIEKMAQLNRFAIRFGGGEPLMVNYLPNLISYCKSLGNEVDITTNGTLINKNMLLRLSNAGLRELTISVDGLQKNHDYIRGFGNYKRTNQSVVQALDFGKIKTSVAFTVTSQNYYEIEDFVKNFVLLGIKKFYFFRYCPNKNSDMLALSTEQLQSSAEQILRLTKEYHDISFVHEGSSFYAHQNGDANPKEGCNFINNVMTIDYCGNVVVCAAIKKILGNIYNEPLDSLYSKIENEQLQIKHIPEECNDCSYDYTCHGGCKNYSYLTAGDYLIKDPFCYIN